MISSSPFTDRDDNNPQLQQMLVSGRDTNPPEFTELKQMRRASDAALLLANRKKLLSEANPGGFLVNAGPSQPFEKQPSVNLHNKITEDFTSLEDEILGLKMPKANLSGGGQASTQGTTAVRGASEDPNTRRISSFNNIPLSATIAESGAVGSTPRKDQL
jgi:hypothetical protein